MALSAEISKTIILELSIWRESGLIQINKWKWFCQKVNIRSSWVDFRKKSWDTLLICKPQLILTGKSCQAPSSCEMVVYEWTNYQTDQRSKGNTIFFTWKNHTIFSPLFFYNLEHSDFKWSFWYFDRKLQNERNGIFKQLIVIKSIF